MEYAYPRIQIDELLSHIEMSVPVASQVISKRVQVDVSFVNDDSRKSSPQGSEKVINDG